MTVALELLGFAAAAALSLTMSGVLVAAIEGFVSAFGVTEATLGLLAALAADAPEITSATTALTHHQQALGAGVTIGSNVFNLAALLGLGALVAGRIVLHRRVVSLAGGVALAIAAICLLTLLGTFSPAVGLAASAVVFAPYCALCASSPERIRSLPGAHRLSGWLAVATAQEDQDLDLSALGIGERRDLGRALRIVGALVVVVLASIVMERIASTLGTHFAVPQIVTGGIVLAAVTSIPNAVAAIYLARRGRAVALLSTAFNSNAINVIVGFFLPATILGLGGASDHRLFVGAWYLALTLAAVVFALWRRSLTRRFGAMIIAAYGVFIAVLVVVANGS